jgi:SsrA-binding protein
LSSRKSQTPSNDIATNRRAFHDYEILETLEAGIVLQGTEVKSARERSVSLQEAYIKIFKNEVFLIGCSIAPYRFGNIYNHKEVQDRKLLLHKREICRLKEAIKEKGHTLVPLAMYLSKGKIKVKFGVAKGKKLHDKRASSKEKDEKRQMQRTLKGE